MRYSDICGDNIFWGCSDIQFSSARAARAVYSEDLPTWHDWMSLVNKSTLVFTKNGSGDSFLYLRSLNGNELKLKLRYINGLANVGCRYLLGGNSSTISVIQFLSPVSNLSRAYACKVDASGYVDDVAVVSSVAVGPYYSGNIRLVKHRINLIKRMSLMRRYFVEGKFLRTVDAWKRIANYYPDILLKIDYNKTEASVITFDNFRFTIELLKGHKYRITGKCLANGKEKSYIKIIPNEFMEFSQERYEHSFAIIKNELCPERFLTH